MELQPRSFVTVLYACYGEESLCSQRTHYITRLIIRNLLVLLNVICIHLKNIVSLTTVIIDIMSIHFHFNNCASVYFFNKPCQHSKGTKRPLSNFISLTTEQNWRNTIIVMTIWFCFSSSVSSALLSVSTVYVSTIESSCAVHCISTWFNVKLEITKVIAVYTMIPYLLHIHQNLA